MSPRYLLPCQCGKSTPIETSQAGQTITCGCGAALAVPTMREIRRLKPADQGAPPAASRRAGSRGWSPLQGGLFALGSVILVLATGAVILGLARRSYIDTTNYYPEMEQAQDAAFNSLAIDESWEIWKLIEQEGLGAQHIPQHVLAQRYYDQHTVMVIISASVAAFGLVLIVAALLMPQRRRST